MHPVARTVLAISARLRAGPSILHHTLSTATSFGSVRRRSLPVRLISVQGTGRQILRGAGPQMQDDERGEKFWGLWVLSGLVRVFNLSEKGSLPMPTLAWKHSRNVFGSSSLKFYPRLGKDLQCHLWAQCNPFVLFLDMNGLTEYGF
jgi:hypothetical protein